MILVLSICLVLTFVRCHSDSQETTNPNVIIFYVDDMGYGDLGCFGNDDIYTPRIDRMAAQGTRLTNFYNSASGCTPSRAALLTGRYHMRCGVNFIPPPSDSKGMSGTEVTIAEMLKEAGYVTAAFGKWHLGTPIESLPKNQGFDCFYGSTSAHTYYLPANYNADDELLAPVFESTPESNTKEVSMIPTRDRTTVLTDKVIEFIRSNNSTGDSKPFFAYVPYPMPHTPISAPLECRGKAESSRGVYADVMLDLDRNVGRTLDSLKTLGLEKNTLVIFASDNGPATVYGNHAGSAYPLRGAKSTEFDGGVRTPCILYWPGTIAPGKHCDTPAATVDILPTLAALIDGAQLPSDRTIDGYDIRSLFLHNLENEYKASQRIIPLYDIAEHKLHAARVGRWKVIYPHKNHVAIPGNDGTFGSYIMEDYPKALYDMESDPQESVDVQDKYPEVVAQIDSMANVVRTDIWKK